MQLASPLDRQINPVAAAPRELLHRDDVLVLKHPKRMVVQRARSETGAAVLRLFYGAKEIEFEADQIAFGEALARQHRFSAAESLGWDPAMGWSTAAKLLAELVHEGILVRAEDLDETGPTSRPQPSPLPASRCEAARDWSDTTGITRDLAGRAVEAGWLEVFVPIFRVAHIYVDADGRQVGEANVFPRGLRLDRATEWMTCIYPGSRHLADKPMNVTALKAMRTHWPQMMAALLRIRTAVLARAGLDAAGPLSVGDIERLATVVLCLPSFQLIRGNVRNGELHPVLSSMFRVTDGLRMVMHHMLFVPAGEPTRAPGDLLTAQEVHDYAERNYSFYSDTGVCAGPQHLIREFLGVMIEGAGTDKYGTVVLDAAVEAALDEIDAAMDYALLGLQSFATAFSFWPKMTRTYERLADVAASPALAAIPALRAFATRLDGHVGDLRSSFFLAKEAWRRDREHVYRELFDGCASLLMARGIPSTTFPDRLPDATDPELDDLAVRIAGVLATAHRPGLAQMSVIDEMSRVIAGFVLQTRAILRTATAVQREINRLLGRPHPAAALSSRDIEAHSLLQGSDARRLPDLFDELAAALKLDIDVTSEAVRIATSDGPTAATQEFGHAV